MKKQVDKSVYIHALIKAIVCIVIPLILYLCFSVFLGFKVYNAVESSFRTNYQRLDYSNGKDEPWKVNSHSFPIVFHNFKTARAEYHYSIEGNTIGQVDVPVTVLLELRDGKWYITDIS